MYDDQSEEWCASTGTHFVGRESGWGWPCIKRLCQVSTFSFWQGSDGKNDIVVADQESGKPHMPLAIIQKFRLHGLSS